MDFFFIWFLFFLLIFIIPKFSYKNVVTIYFPPEIHIRTFLMLTLQNLLNAVNLIGKKKKKKKLHHFSFSFFDYREKLSILCLLAMYFS